MKKLGINPSLIIGFSQRTPKFSSKPSLNKIKKKSQFKRKRRTYL